MLKPLRKGKLKLTEWATSNNLVLSLICWTCGLTNLENLPELLSKYGNVGAILPFVVTNLLIAIPLLFAELSVGQYTSRSLLGAWRMAPIWKGIGFASIFFLFLMGTNTAYLTSQALFYSMKSLSWELPWSTCGTWSNEKCFNLTAMKNFDWSPNGTVVENNFEQYYNTIVLRGNSGKINVSLICATIFVLVWIFICLCKILTSIEKVLNFLTLVPFMFLSILMLTSLFYPGTLQGLCKFLSPNLDALKNINLWMEMANINIFSLGLGIAGLITIASHANFRTNLYSTCMFVPMFSNLRDVFFSVFVYSSYAGYCIWENISVDALFNYEASLLFIKIPMVISRWPFYPHIWNFIYFTYLFMIGFRSLLFVMLTLIENIQEQSTVCLVYRKTLMGVICGTIFLFEIVYFTEAGMNIIRYIEKMTSGPIILLIVFIQFIGIFYIYGAGNLVKDIYFMLNRKTKFIKYYWKVLPLVTLTILLYKLYIWNITIPNKKWLLIFEIILFISIFVCWFISLLGYCFENRRKDFKALWEPSEDWGNRNTDIRKNRDLFKNEVIGEEFTYRQDLFSREIPAHQNL